MKKNAFLALLMVLVFAFTGCAREPEVEKEVSESQFLLGTIIGIQLYGTEDTTHLEKCFDIIKQVDDWMSLNILESEINALNAQAGKGPISVSDEIFYVVQVAKHYGDVSLGRFDISMEPVVKLWGIGSDTPKVPGEEALKEALSHVDYTQIILNEGAKTLELKEGMAIDLGGIGKGYAADLVRDYLGEVGISKAILNLGGNIVAVGEKAKDTPFKVGLQSPFEERNTYFGFVEVSDKSVVTSGVYERNFTLDGVTYHHILDTDTGYPVDNGLASVAVVTNRSIDADALSTTLFVLGIEKGLALVNGMDDVECLFVTKESHIYKSNGMNAIFTLSDTSFTE